MKKLISPMRLLNLNKAVYFLFLILIGITNSNSEEEPVDIWKKKNENIEIRNSSIDNGNKINSKKNIFGSKTEKTEIEIKEEVSETFEETKLYGVFDPNKNDLNLSIWENTDGKEFKYIIDRINKLKLSKFAEKIFINTIYSYSYLPKNLSEDEFLKIKIDWIIENKKDDLAEDFLNKNKDFKYKKKLIQYLVDKNISKANIIEGCQKVGFISKDIKDPYLEKFKIYCLIFNDKKNQAQLLFDILKEEGRSDKFFNSKINFLLGISEKDDGKISDNNLLNFYLSSVTVSEFEYEPKKNTKKTIWEYLDSANLIKVKDIEDKEKIKNFEIAANENRLEKEKIFNIYKKIPFDLNTLINAENIYQSISNTDARALIYQRFLLSDNQENKIQLLFLLKDLFKKDKLSNIYTEFLSNRLKEFEAIDIPSDYQQAFKNNIISEKQFQLGKIKFDDKVLHRSKVLKYFIDSNASLEKSQKDLNNIYKKIRRNKAYFFSAKDLALIESLEKDGFKIPKEINFKKIAAKYNVPNNLLKLAKDNQQGYMILKIVEIIGEDEVQNLDSETIYFITNLLNYSNLTKMRNEILISALPLRT
jgi:hypothetical protein